jgi:hypothetical protein
MIQPDENANVITQPDDNSKILAAMLSYSQLFPTDKGPCYHSASYFRLTKGRVIIQPAISN